MVMSSKAELTISIDYRNPSNPAVGNDFIGQRAG
jgi:hypothetical protein